MPFLRSKSEQLRDRIAYLEQQVNRQNGCDGTRNLFYDLPSELQTKIFFTNVMHEFPSNPSLVRKQQFKKAIKNSLERAITKQHVTCPFITPRGTHESYYYRYDPNTTDRKLRTLTLRSIDTHAWFVMKDSASILNEKMELDDICLCSLSSQDLIFKQFPKLFQHKKQELRQLCQDNGLWWGSSWTIKRLNKELMTI
jgi:hypothetical protein